jgi:beta propeller repeat protein
MMEGRLTKKAIPLSLLIAGFWMQGAIAAPEFPITISNAFDCSLCNGIIVWQDFDFEVQIKNLSTGQSSVITPGNDFSQPSFPTTDGTYVVWIDYRNSIQCENPDIYGQQLSGGSAFPICTRPGMQVMPFISNGIVVWAEYISTGYGIFGMNLHTTQEFTVCTSQRCERPKTRGDYVVWADQRNGNWDIYAYNLQTQQEIPICLAPGDQRYPDVDYPYVVWHDSRDNRSDVYGFNLAEGKEFVVGSTYSSSKHFPRISGHTVVWGDTRNGDYDIFAKDLVTGNEFAVISRVDQQETPLIDGNLVVWEDDRNGTYWGNSIYGKYLDDPVRFEGQIELGAFSGDHTKVPVSLSLIDTGDGRLVEEHILTTDADHFFGITSNLSGSFKIKAKPSHWLRAGVIANTSTDSPYFRLVNGDCDNDNTVTSTDLSVVLSAMASMPGDPNWNPMADLNGDGVITSADASIVLASMDTVGTD